MNFGNKNFGSDYLTPDLSTEQRIELEVSKCEKELEVFESTYL